MFAFAVVFCFVNSTQDQGTWEEELQLRNASSLDWPVGKSVGAFSLPMMDARGPSALWEVAFLSNLKVVELGQGNIPDFSPQ